MLRASRKIDGLYSIGAIRPLHCRALAQLFRHAIENDFSYYSSDYQKLTQRQNTAAKLCLGALRKSRVLIGVWYTGELVGYLIGATRPGSSDGDVFWLYVRPDHRGKKLGADLLLESIRNFRALGIKNLELVTYDHADFYKKHDFQVERLAKGFIGGQDVYIMKRSLV